ncbi:DNA ligase D [Tahibacter soli]|uniref:DNA ligase (ATP) n=1 Tax=Tahibacter soli TaxID=2983605 RepID=A0A9X4BLP6_9GAMM|nr:DNA ligase D [Tahibacter soli]MDC8014489.1 DNA ligase D [Tahibacter soli]
MALKEYRRKRDFGQTPEPAKGGRRGGGLFVVQLHHASRRHYDFRLELDGVLKSWAVPKGPSFDPSVKRLAVEVEDHPISYAGFEGDIPEGHYGAGHVDVYDTGTWKPENGARAGFEKGELKFSLHGDVLRGSWVLVRTRKVGRQQQWLLIKHDDEYAGKREADDYVDAKTDRPLPKTRRRRVWKTTEKPPAARKTATKKAPAKKTAKRSARERASPPVRSKKEKIDNAPFAPELCAVRDAPPAGDGWLHEVKWDGYRLLATVVGGKARLWSRNAIEWTAKVPELAEAIASLGFRDAQIDGEMVVIAGGAVDFNALQGRLSAQNKVPVTYMLFDLPHADGRTLRDVPLLERKALLAERIASRPHAALRYSEHHVGDGATVFAQIVDGGYEGIVSKRVDSGYSGRRGGDWVKVKRRASDEFAVVGFTAPKRARVGFGALLLGRPARGGGFEYAGRVGTGFDDALLRQLHRALARDVVGEPPVVDVSMLEPRERRESTWVRPKLVVEVFHQGTGGQGLLRQPAFKALRRDKSPADLRGRAAVRKEKAMTDVVLTHPERVAYPKLRKTKQDVADYYRAVAPQILREIAGRPLSVVRCPDGIAHECFFQKHLGRGWGDHVYGTPIAEKNGTKDYLRIDDEAGLVELVQMNVLEFHPWGARADDPDHADRLVFDLDPAAGVAWPRVVKAARDVRRALDAIGLSGYLRTSGGKGLHVVVPLKPAEPWDAVKAFARAFAETLAANAPDDYVAVAGEARRKGRIFIDWLRNGRGATSVASYSLRARDAAGVAMPLSWASLGKLASGADYTIDNAAAFVRRRKRDPWNDIDDVRQSLPREDVTRPARTAARGRSRG